MAVAYKKRLSNLSKLYKVANASPYGRGAILLGTAAYMGYEIIDDYFNSPPTSLPLPKQKQQSNSTIAPSVKEHIESAIKSVDNNIKTVDAELKIALDDLDSKSSEIYDSNEAIGNSYSDTPLLQNQIYLKDALDSISSHFEVQNVMAGTFYQLLSDQLTLLNNSLLTMAQNKKVLVDKTDNIAGALDYGDEDFFYAFKPTFEFWAEVDIATRNKEIEEKGTDEFLFILPSSFSAPSEIDLIDRMQEKSSKSEIRTAVEAFRRNNVSSEIRARLGQELVQTKIAEREGTNAQAEYHKASTSAIKAKEIAPTSALRNYGATTDYAMVGALHSLASSLAPVREWAEVAKVRETYLQTPSELLDMDGNVIGTAKPMELATIKDATVAREKTDINTMEYTPDMFPDMTGAIGLPVLPFVGRESIFDEGSSDPSPDIFHPKTLS